MTTTDVKRFSDFNAEDVRPFLADYEIVRAEIEAWGEYPYNDSFKGRIPGLAGKPDEDRGIYLLQTLHRLDASSARLEEFLASGGYPAIEHDPSTPFRGTVVETGFYVGGTGWRVHKDARLVFRNGKPHAVLPPRARNHGHLLNGVVYLRKEGAKP